MSNPIEAASNQYRGNGAPLRELLRDDREWVICYTCPRNNRENVRHPLRGGNAVHDYRDFAANHPASDGHTVCRIGPDYMEGMVRQAEQYRDRLGLSQRFIGNADVKEAFGAVVNLDPTAVGIATSVTAGWCSNWYDNSAGLYLDTMFYVSFIPVNTIASSQKAIYLYGPGAPSVSILTYVFTVTSASATVGATYTNNGNTFTVVATIAAATILVLSTTAAGAPQASGTLTKATGTGDATIAFSASVNSLPSNTAGNGVPNSSATSALMTHLDVTANDAGFPLIGTIPYLTTNKYITSNRLVGIAKGHDGTNPKYSWLGLVNAAGPTLNATGAQLAATGVYNTVI